MAWFKSAVFFLLSLACMSDGQLQSLSAVDKTLQVGASGSDVVRATQARLDHSRLFAFTDSQVYELFIREVAYVESQDGADDRDGGIWGVSEAIFNHTKQYIVNVSELYNGICTTYCIDWISFDYSRLRTPLYSGIAIHIYLHHLYNTNRRLSESATDTEKEMFWLTHFQSLRARWSLRIPMLRKIQGTQQLE